MRDLAMSLIVTPLEVGFPHPLEEDTETNPQIPLIKIEDGEDAESDEEEVPVA